MTLEQENEYKALVIISEAKDGLKQSEINSRFPKEFGMPEAERILDKFYSSYLIDKVQTPIQEGQIIYAGIENELNKYYLSEAGREYLLYLNETKRNEALATKQIISVIETNESVKTTNQIQRRLGWITLAVAACALGVSVLDYFKKEDKNIYLLPTQQPVKLQENIMPDTQKLANQIPDSL